MYYGTEQGLSGTVDGNGNPVLNSNESVREALWARTPVAFDKTHLKYQIIKQLSTVRVSDRALCYGRLYFREVSGNGTDFGRSSGKGGIVAFSRILVDREVLIVANTNNQGGFSGSVIVDHDLNATPRKMRVVFSNFGKSGKGTVRQIPAARFFSVTGISTGPAAALPTVLDSSEVQVLAPL